MHTYGALRSVVVRCVYVHDTSDYYTGTCDARGTSGRGVAAECSPVTTPYRIAYAVCSKNVVGRVNEAKLRTVVSCTHQGHAL